MSVRNYAILYPTRGRGGGASVGGGNALLSTEQHAISGSEHTGTLPHADLSGLSADDHPQYVREVDASWVDLTDAGETTLHSHAAVLAPDDVRDAGRWEVVMTPGITDPPEPVWTPAGDDYVYAWVTD